MPFALAIDQSTSATKALLFDAKGAVCKRVTIEHRQFYPQHGFVEHDAEQILANVYRSIEEVITQSAVNPKEIQYLALTNQRETVVVWDRIRKKPIAPAVVWQDQRGAALCAQLKSTQYNQIIQSRTGLIVDSYFSATKITWILEHVSGAKAAARRGDLLWGTMDSWIIWNLTGQTVHATDYSNACRTMLFDIHACRWDDELLDLFGISKQMCPEARPSDASFGTAIIPRMSISLPIRGVMGDSHAALFGQRCFTPGMGKVTYGTGSSVMINSGEKKTEAPSGIVHSIGWACQNRVVYVLEGNIHTAGDVMRWLRDNLAMIADNREAERIAAALPSSEGVFLVPAFDGLSAPHWRHDLSALITGLHRSTTKAHIIRAALESIAYQVVDVIDAAAQRIGVTEICADGGPTNNKFLMQFQSDMLNIPVQVNRIEEVSALGVFYMGAISLNILGSIDEISALQTQSERYTPRIPASARAELLQGWHSALAQTMGTR